MTVSTGLISTIAGTGASSYSGDGGAATSASLCFPASVALDASGDIYIADQGNHRIRKVTVSTGLISTIAGSGSGSYSGDGGAATAASLKEPHGVVVDYSSGIYIFIQLKHVIHYVTIGNVYIADTYNQRIRQVTGSTGIITTIAGTGSTSFSGDGSDAIIATLNTPTGVALDSLGNLYIADFNNNRVRKVAILTGIISTFAGTGASGYNGDGMDATKAALDSPSRVAVDISGRPKYPYFLFFISS